MSSALTVTRRLTQAVLGAAALGTAVIAGHLALSHTAASAAPAGAQTQTQSSQPGAGAAPTQGHTRGGTAFGPAPGVQGGTGGVGSTATHGS